MLSRLFHETMVKTEFEATTPSHIRETLMSHKRAVHPLELIELDGIGKDPSTERPLKSVSHTNLQRTSDVDQHITTLGNL